MKELKQGALKGEVQMYMHCFNLDIVGNGTVVPEGVTFPGAYKPNDFAFKFDPYMTYGTPDPAAAIAHNSKYVSSVSMQSDFMELTKCGRFHLVHLAIMENTTCLQGSVSKSKKLDNILPLLRLHIRI
jgi:hypothetical protein